MVAGDKVRQSEYTEMPTRRHRYQCIGDLERDWAVKDMTWIYLGVLLSTGQRTCMLAQWGEHLNEHCMGHGNHGAEGVMHSDLRGSPRAEHVWRRHTRLSSLLMIHSSIATWVILEEGGKVAVSWVDFPRAGR